jgi:hypothetical protein
MISSVEHVKESRCQHGEAFFLAIFRAVTAAIGGVTSQLLFR